ncbi:MAG: hypothetical protein KAT52_06765 [Desulfobacterales bacterium]|jgi:hypothetical protein|nr:hypothetical protein [Desulfobacterales bacterium]
MWSKIITQYFDLNNRYHEAIIRRARRQDPEELRALGGNSDEIKRNPFSLSHQILMFSSAFIGVFIQNGISQYIDSQPIIFSFPTFFELMIYGAISMALMPHIYARLAKIPSPPMIAQMGWAVLYGFFSRPVLVATKELILATIKALSQT